MTVDSKARDLFIVDNSVSGWTGLRYLDEWTTIARAFDIATGYFEIGALLALDGKWQQLDKIRILMGAEITHRSRKALLDAVRSRALLILDGSIEADKDANPFLRGVPAILEALCSGQIECRVYDKDKFHAKAYITHAKLEVVGAQALVGSSNFTAPGLTKNIELNIQVQSAREVAQLQEWFESHWNDATEVTDAVIESISRHTHLYTPFDVYAKALREFFRGHELTASEWDDTRPGRYQAVLPAFIAGWDAVGLKAQVAFGLPDQVALAPPANLLERRYALRSVQQRLHQASFREAVIAAYDGRCALSGLPEPLLLDAAHIVADADERLGQPVVPNGLPLSKIHHAAFDAHLIGIDPDYRLHVSQRLLVQRDGPMLEALKRLNGEMIHLPSRVRDRPDRERLAQRFERFKEAA